MMVTHTIKRKIERTHTNKKQKKWKIKLNQTHTRQAKKLVLHVVGFVLFFAFIQLKNNENKRRSLIRFLLFY